MSWGDNWGNFDHEDAETALTNFALTFAKALLVFCVILFVMISDNQKKDDGVKPKVEAMIIVDWSKEPHIDVDSWTRNPQGGIVYFQNKEAGTVFLDRDDLGDKCITVCEEITSLRGLTAGEYVFNLNIYNVPSDQLAETNEYSTKISSNDSMPGATQKSVPAGYLLKTPLVVHVRIIKLNPEVKVLFERDVIMTYLKEEHHVVSFTISDGKIEDFETDRNIMIMPRAGK